MTKKIQRNSKYINDTKCSDTKTIKNFMQQYENSNITKLKNLILKKNPKAILKRIL